MIRKIKITSKQYEPEEVIPNKYYIFFSRENDNNEKERFIMESSAYFSSGELQNRNNENIEIVDKETAKDIIKKFLDESCIVTIIDDDDYTDCDKSITSEEIIELLNQLS